MKILNITSIYITSILLITTQVCGSTKPHLSSNRLHAQKQSLPSALISVANRYLHIATEPPLFITAQKEDAALKNIDTLIKELVHSKLITEENKKDIELWNKKITKKSDDIQSLKNIIYNSYFSHHPTDLCQEITKTTAAIKSKTSPEAIAIYYQQDIATLVNLLHSLATDQEKKELSQQLETMHSYESLIS